MSYVPITPSYMIELAFVDYHDDIAGFVEELIEYIRYGVPEQMLIAAKKELAALKDKTKATWLKLLIALG